MSERGQDEVVERREREYVDASEVSWAVRALQRAQIELDRALADQMGLRALDYAAMTFLLQATHPPGPVELATWLGISTGSGPSSPTDWSAAGTCTAAGAADDRRRVVLELDHDAVAAMVDRLRPLFTDLEHVADTFTEDERAAITRYLGPSPIAPAPTRPHCGRADRRAPRAVSSTTPAHAGVLLRSPTRRRGEGVHVVTPSRWAARSAAAGPPSWRSSSRPSMRAMAASASARRVPVSPSSRSAAQAIQASTSCGTTRS